MIFSKKFDILNLGENMKDSYVIEYLNESEFKKKERNIKKYHMLTYKKLIFDYYPSIKEGKFPGTLIHTNDGDKIKKYELRLPTDETFVKIHGNITLHYKVDLERKTVILETLTPEDILSEGHQKGLTTYKGTMASKTYKETDMFKINLLDMLNQKKQNK